MIAHYAVEDKWRSELKIQDDLLHPRKWKCQSNCTLERFIAQHRNSFVSMTQFAEHVVYQLPNEGTRVTYIYFMPLKITMRRCKLRWLCAEMVKIQVGR